MKQDFWMLLFAVLCISFLCNCEYYDDNVGGDGGDGGGNEGAAKQLDNDDDDDDNGDNDQGDDDDGEDKKGNKDKKHKFVDEEISCRMNKECQKHIANSVCINAECVCESTHRLVEKESACKPTISRLIIAIIVLVGLAFIIVIIMACYLYKTSNINALLQLDEFEKKQDINYFANDEYQIPEWDRQTTRASNMMIKQSRMGNLDTSQVMNAIGGGMNSPSTLISRNPSQNIKHEGNV